MIEGLTFAVFTVIVMGIAFTLGRSWERLHRKVRRQRRRHEQKAPMVGEGEAGAAARRE